MRFIQAIFFAGLLSAATQHLVGQERVPAPTPAEESLKLFLDCQTFLCDYDYFRREIGFVNWVRDRQVAELHLLITAQSTGGGGWQLALTFIGLDRFQGREDTFHTITRAAETNAEIRTRIVQVIKAGLMRYVASTPALAGIAITYRSPVTAAAVPIRDPWNYWVFTVRGGIDANGEQRQKAIAGNGSLSANRTTDLLKLNVSFSGRYSRSEFELSPGNVFVTTQKNVNLNTLGVRSLGPHWSAGVRTTASSSTFLNQDFALQMGPALEYNIYPYSESSRRQLTMQYALGFSSFTYEEPTIFDKTSEVLPTHNLEISVRLQQPWGSINTSVRGLQFLHDRNGSKHRIDVFGGFNLRILRGLALNMFANFARVKDQLYLRRGTLTPEEILVRRRQLGTDYRYSGFLSLSYTFGSQFSNIVNPRMGGGGGGVIIFQ